jgi:hypothetical protein
LRPRRPPPGPQQVEQAWREHDVAVPAAFALLDPNDHSLTVDVADLERDDFGGAQARAVGYAERRLVLEPRRSIEQPCHFLRAQHYWQLARFVNERRLRDDLVTPERDAEEKP